MLSACANPVIYGFLNENFHREFKDLFNIVKKKFTCCKKHETELFETGMELNPLMENGANGVAKDHNGTNEMVRNQNAEMNGV